MTNYYRVSLWLGAGVEMHTVLVEAKDEEEALVLASLEIGIVIDADEADEDICESDCYTYLDRTEYGPNDCVYLLTECATIEKLENKTFVVCMDSCYVRDAQKLYCEDMTDEEFDEVTGNMHAPENDNFWGDMEPTPFIDVVSAATEEHACAIAAERKRYDARCLFAFEPKPTNI